MPKRANGFSQLFLIMPNYKPLPLANYSPVVAKEKPLPFATYSPMDARDENGTKFPGLCRLVHLNGNTIVSEFQLLSGKDGAMPGSEDAIWSLDKALRTEDYFRLIRQKQSGIASPIPTFETDICIFGHQLWELTKRDLTLSEGELRLEFMDAVDKERRRYETLRRRHEGLESEPKQGREPISEKVRIYVWRRDEGRCVRCGSSERLEYDHIVPFSKGGSNTERNIQLLCETCNRSKGASI